MEFDPEQWGAAGGTMVILWLVWNILKTKAVNGTAKATTTLTIQVATLIADTKAMRQQHSEMDRKITAQFEKYDELTKRVTAIEIAHGGPREEN